MAAHSAPFVEIDALISRLGLHHPDPDVHCPAWDIDALSGRFIELSSDGACASTTAAVSLILQAQHRGEPAVWIAADGSTFFPPDAARAGVDLGALPIVRAGNMLAAVRAADTTLRSGAFAVVVLDLGRNADISVPIQGRLVGLAQKHRAVFACLTRKHPKAPSIGPLVSVRAQTRTQKVGVDHFRWEIRAIKDKRFGPGWRHMETARGPEGLR